MQSKIIKVKETLFGVFERNISVKMSNQYHPNPHLLRYKVLYVAKIKAFVSKQ